MIRIVIADDHALFRDGLRKLLALEEDFRVVAEAKDGKEALAALLEHQPDILLLDLKMPPGPDGLVTLQRLRNSRIRTKVIVLTACEEKAQIARAIRFGACGIVSKETATELLMEGIRKVHDGGSWLDTTMTTVVMHPSLSHVQGDTSGSSNHNRVQLSQREREITVLVAQGLKNRQLAERMVIREQTVKNHLHNIFTKLGVSDRVELVLYAIRNKIKSSDQR